MPDTQSFLDLASSANPAAVSPQPQEQTQDQSQQPPPGLSDQTLGQRVQQQTADMGNQQAPAPAAPTQSPSAHQSFFSELLHAVGDVLGGPKTRSVVNPQTGQIEQQPLSRRERIAGQIGTMLRGAAAGAAQHGPGAVGAAALAGAESAEQTQAVSHQRLMDQAALVMRNNEWLLQQREFDLRSKEFQQQQINQDNAIAAHVQEVGGRAIPILSNGKDINGTSDEQGLMAWKMQNRAPQGYDYLPVVSQNAQGQRTYTIYQIPHPSLNDVRSYSANESAAMGLPHAEHFLTLKDALGFQETYNKMTGAKETADKYIDQFSSDKWHLGETQDDLTSQQADLAQAYRWSQSHPMYGSQLMPIIRDRVNQVQGAMSRQKLPQTKSDLAVQQSIAEEAGKQPYQLALKQQDALVTQGVANNKDARDKIDTQYLKPLNDKVQAANELVSSLADAEAGNSAASKAALFKMAGLSMPTGSKRLTPQVAETLLKQGNVPQQFIGKLKNALIGDEWTSQMSQDMQEFAQHQVQVAKATARAGILQTNALYNASVDADAVLSTVPPVVVQGAADNPAGLGGKWGAIVRKAADPKNLNP
ncbi:MAG TPA: hypothetical protein VKV39_06630 [Candidatus Sulfotelmatobacter sp.]|nr:hypothetical protein [Candidatus Sulfotelmatobacter sp.]